MKKLEEYYNRLTANDGNMPVFSVLSDEGKERLRKSLGFAFYNASQAMSDFSYQLLKHLQVYCRR